MHGSIYAEYQDEIEDRLEMIEDGERLGDEDALDIALRTWLAKREE
jgi:hypothetical protein